MRQFRISPLVGMLILCSFLNINAQEFKQHLSKEFVVSNTQKGILYIYNVNGFIRVEAYDGNKVIMEMDELINADDPKNLEIGKKEFRLAFDQQEDTILAYIAAPFDSRPHRRWKFNDDREDVNYNYKVDFTLKVPADMNLHISTVNDGIITIDNVRGNLHVNNVNEEIKITNAAGTTYAHTVNGDVSIIYLKNPSEESSYYTINGDIKISYQPGLAADIQFKSMHGDLFTNFADAELQPAVVVKKQEKKDGVIVYKLSTNTAVRFGKGGTSLKFETLNGNVYIKKQS